MKKWYFCSLLLPALVLTTSVSAQSSKETQKKLQSVKKELKTVGEEKKKIDAQRGDATVELKKADQKVNDSSKTLASIQKQLSQQQQELNKLKKRQAELDLDMAGKRDELARLLRASYVVENDHALKVMLSQDTVAEANRAMTYHGYLQRQRTERIRQLNAELKELSDLEMQIVQKQNLLTATAEQEKGQKKKLEQEQAERKKVVAELDTQFRDKQAREQALSKDAKSLEKVLVQLREQAARAERERIRRQKAAAATAKKEAASTGGGKTGKSSITKQPKTVAKMSAPIAVGGLSWPVSGSLLAGFGGTMPDGRSSKGVLIAAPAGTTVKAIADGTVVYSQWMTGYGMILIIDHGGEVMSLYAYNDSLLKDAGAQVKRGDAIAKVGTSGGQDRPALYFELRQGGQPINPNRWLQRQ